MTRKTGPLSQCSVSLTSFMPVADFGSRDGQQELEKLMATYPPSPADPPHRDFARSLLTNEDESTCMFFASPAQTNLGVNRAKELLLAPQPGNFLTLCALLVNPLSRGYSHITTADPAAKPSVNTKYLSHPLDMEILARHVRFLETLATTQPLAGLLELNGKRNVAFKAPIKSVDDAKAYIRRTAMSLWHPVGTCAMMPRAKGGVLDAALKVYGTTNLRVVDASAMPIIPQANTQTTVYAVAERAADIIKKAHGMATAA